MGANGKSNGQGEIRLGLVADIHQGPDHLTKRGSQAQELLKAFFEHAGRFRPDLIIDLGDRISDQSPEKDRTSLALVAEAFRSCPWPRAHLLGNHDLVNLSPQENAGLLEAEMGHRSLELGGWRLILWQAEVDLRSRAEKTSTQADLDSLAGALAGPERPTVVFSHLPVSGLSQTGNYYFESNPDYSVHPRYDWIRGLLNQTACPLVWVAGHVHWNSLAFVDGLPHLTIQSLTESFTTPPRPCGAYADLILSRTGFSLTVHGSDPMTLGLPLPRSGPQRWQPPLGPGFSAPGGSQSRGTR